MTSEEINERYSIKKLLEPDNSEGPIKEDLSEKKPKPEEGIYDLQKLIGQGYLKNNEFISKEPTLGAELTRDPRPWVSAALTPVGPLTSFNNSPLPPTPTFFNTDPLPPNFINKEKLPINFFNRKIEPKIPKFRPVESNDNPLSVNFMGLSPRYLQKLFKYSVEKTPVRRSLEREGYELLEVVACSHRVPGRVSIDVPVGLESRLHELRFVDVSQLSSVAQTGQFVAIYQKSGLMGCK